MLNSTPKIQYRPLQDEAQYSAQFDGRLCRVENNQCEFLEAQVEFMTDSLQLRLDSQASVQNPNMMLGVGLDYLFSHFPQIKTAHVLAGDASSRYTIWNQFAIEGSTELRVEWNEFYQQPYMWLGNTGTRQLPETSMVTNGRQHPVRAILTGGTHYRRYVPAIQATVSFRTVDVERDLEIFHNWHNQHRVYALWELNKSKEDLREYLEKGLQDPHQIPMIMEIDNEPVGYFEFYWAAEDRIGPYYEYEAYDRGLHFLIGNKKFLGQVNTDTALRSALHYLYLDEPRTKRVVAEPRSDNKKVLKYVQVTPGWTFVKEFDFPHKRAALLMNFRDLYYEQGAL